MYNSTGKTRLNNRGLFLIVSFVAVTLAVFAFFQWTDIQTLTQSLVQRQAQIRNLIAQVEGYINGAPDKSNDHVEVKNKGRVKSESEVEVQVDILKLKMADPSLFTEIRKKYLVAPSSEPYQLKEPLKKEYPQYKGIVKLLDDLFPMATTAERGGQRQRFFIEAGAFDGEYLSNTLNLERDRNWTGLLVEPNPKTFERLKAKNRKAWLLNSCLSTKNEPMNLTLEFHKKSPALSRIQNRDNKRFGAWEKSAAIKKTMTCLPIYAILSAINVTTVDFFSLDVEGAEVDVLRTIPFNKIYIKVLLIEQWRRNNAHLDLIKFMEGKNYVQHPFPPSRENFLFLHPKFLREHKKSFYFS